MPGFLRDTYLRFTRAGGFPNRGAEIMKNEKRDRRPKSVHGSDRARSTAQRPRHAPASGDPRSGRFRIPNHPHGRLQDHERLRHAFSRVTSGQPRTVLITGDCGAGKTFLAKKFLASLTEREACFAAGAFEPSGAADPYPALLQALRRLVPQLLSEEEGSLRRLKAAMATELGSAAPALVSMIPEMAALVGPPPEGPPAAFGRPFSEALRALLEVVARPERPLVLFFDDWQWADPPTLHLFQRLAEAAPPAHLLLIIAGREPSTLSTHPAGRCIRDLDHGGWKVSRVSLAPLAPEEVSLFIADITGGEAERALPLAEVVTRKTGGNYLLLIGFLKKLHRLGIVRYDHARGEWCWELALAEGTIATGNVTETQDARLAELSEEGRRLLATATCLGTSFALLPLAALARKAPAEILPQLRECVGKRLLRRTLHAAPSGVREYPELAGENHSPGPRAGDPNGGVSVPRPPSGGNTGGEASQAEPPHRLRSPHERLLDAGREEFFPLSSD